MNIQDTINDLIKENQKLNERLHELEDSQAKTNRKAKPSGHIRKFLLTGFLLFLISGGFFLFAEGPALPTKFRDGQVLSEQSLNDMREKINELFGARVPLGGVIAWHRDFAGEDPQLPGGFVECNGQVIQMEGSTYDGKNAPNLNGVSGVGHENSPDLGAPERLFLRGGTISGRGETDAIQFHGHSASNSVLPTTNANNITPPSTFVMGKDTGFTSLQNRIDITITGPTQLPSRDAPRVAEETRPKSMSVIYIIRVK